MDTDNFSLLWTNYFTLKTRQVYQRFPYGGRTVGTLSESFSLAKEASAAKAAGHALDIFSVESIASRAVHEIGNWYKLYQADPNFDVTVTPGEGWWPSESSHRWSGSNGDTCSIYIDTKFEATEIFIEASYLDMPDGRSITATVNSIPLHLEHNKNHLRTSKFRLAKGRNVIEFRTSFLPEPPSAWDPRTLSLAWTSVVVKFSTANQ